MINRLNQFILAHHLFNSGDRILLTVSGGADSMMMCDLFRQAGYNFGIAHGNFQLRGEESVRDENFVREYAARHHIPFYITHFDTNVYAEQKKISIQEAARELRYRWFDEIRSQHDFTFIATAHHLNDHIETLLINFFKGTGIHGLHGIPVRQGKIIRPILFLTKEEILQYIRENNLPFVEDSSNLSDKYTRNYIRHQVIPVIKKIFPGIERQLNQNIERFSEAGLLYEQAIDLHRKKLVEARGEEFFIPVLKLKKSIPLATVCYELFKTWNFSMEQSRQIINMLDSEPGKTISSSTHRLIRDRKWLIITPLMAKKSSIIQIEKNQSHAEGDGFSLHLKRVKAVDHTLSRNETTASLNAAGIVYPLILRPWRQGDYFYPLGLNKKKKISRFLIDRKIPLHDKEDVWVLESEKKIIWVAGMRIDHRFRITESTEEVLQIVYKKGL